MICKSLKGKNMDSLGRHVLVEFYDCEPEILNDVSTIENNMVAAAKEAGATVINSTFHYFSPFGVSGVVVIQESHLAIHTWPEYRYAAVDLFTCGDPVDPWVSYNYLKKAFKAGHGSSMEIRRGQLNLLEPSKIEIPQLRQKSEEKIPVPKYTRNIWFTERDEYTALSLRHKGDPLFRQQSEFQKVEIYDTYQYGKMLTCDNMIMCAEEDEHSYHEMISHVPMFTHPNPKRVLVVGGGDGGTVREIVKHEQIKEVVLVEIDEVVIEASKKHLPSLASALDHPKLKLHIEDGIKYVSNTENESFDIVLIDSTDPVGPAVGLFNAAFFKQVRRILSNPGIMVTQSESPRYNTKIFKEIYTTHNDIFGTGHVSSYLAYIPTYPSGMWSFSYCTKGNIDPIKDFRATEAQKFTINQKLNYYSEDIHRAAFVLPRFVKEMLKEQ
jgi:spermidine synthase